MQTFITDRNFSKSAENLDVRRLNAQVYEGIHILSSLLDVNHKLVNPKRSVLNHPITRMWKGHEESLLFYIAIHLREKRRRGHKLSGTINFQNYIFLCGLISMKQIDSPEFITDELIKEYKKKLYEKDSEFYSQWKNE